MSSEITTNGNTGGHGFGVEEIELGLRLTVLSGGDCGRAARLMKAEGHPVEAKTLRKWKDRTYSNRYEQLVEQIREELDTETKDMSKVLAAQAQAVEQDLLQELAKKKGEVKPKDLARSVQAMAQTASTHTQVARLLEERPTHIVESRPPSELIAELKELGVLEGEILSESSD